MRHFATTVTLGVAMALLTSACASLGRLAQVIQVDGTFTIDAGALARPAFGPMRLFDGRLGR